MFLMAGRDWFSRYVLAWRTSLWLDAALCIAALEEALDRGRPEIFNTDQGAQFSSAAWTDRLRDAQAQISMDGRGRCFDNIFIERLWRSVKYEKVYLKDYADRRRGDHGRRNYFEFTNTERPHQALGYRTAREVHEATASRQWLRSNREKSL